MRQIWASITSIRVFMHESWNKADLAEKFAKAFNYVNDQNDKLRQSRSQLKDMKSELEKSQSKVIALQEELLSRKDEMLGAVLRDNTNASWDDAKIEGLLNEVSTWIERTAETLKWDIFRPVSSSRVKKSWNKEEMAEMFAKAFKYVKDLNDKLRQSRSQLRNMKSEFDKSQSKIIALQEELLSRKDEMLESVFRDKVHIDSLKSSSEEATQN